MEFSKSKILPVAGMIVLLIFIAMSYFNNHIFLDKIIICSLILGMIFFVKIIGEGNGNQPNANDTKYTNPT